MIICLVDFVVNIVHDCVIYHALLEPWCGVAIHIQLFVMLYLILNMSKIRKLINFYLGK